MRKFFPSCPALFFIMLILLMNNTSNAQHISGSTMDQPVKNTYSNPNNNPPSPKNSIDTNAYIEDKLVQLALTQPSYDETQNQINISQHELKKAKNSWLNLLSLSTSLNDQTFAQPTQLAGSTYTYPKYFFGVSIPLGLIFLSGTEIKIAKSNVAIEQDRQQELARTIKADILSKYSQYKAYSQLLALQAQIVDDEDAVFLQTEQKFKDGTITIDVYNGASKNYNNELVKKINLQLQLDQTKLEIEKMIGVNLDDVINFKIPK